MQKTMIDGVAMWSRWQPDRNLAFNSYFIETAGGNLIVDPLELDPQDAAEIFAAGGAAWIVITNRDHERATRSVATLFGSKVAASRAEAAEISTPVDRIVNGGESIEGASVIALEGLKTAGEFALYFAEKDTVIVGDALWGDPAGSVRMMPDDKLADPAAAARSLRALLSQRPRHLLVGDGTPVFGRASETIAAFLETRTDAYPNRINIDELTYTKSDGPSRFADFWAEIGFLIGAQKLGYAITRLEPGIACCPMHWHVAEEELFIVWDGTPTLESPHGSMPLRRGDFVCLPARPFGAHRLVNNSSAPASIILIANSDPSDVCFYPDSKKVAIRSTRTIVRSEPLLDYFDGEA
ncbi:MAG: cupin domain-containing protein [Candidatus Eremiobacteraeota bacterium]|nr:cupin domain-containing protein [Candidatus Eremiobacteraeota bacterium]